MFHARPVLWHDTLHIFSKLFHGASIWCHALLRPARKSAALLLMAHASDQAHTYYVSCGEVFARQPKIPLISHFAKPCIMYVMHQIRDKMPYL